MKKFILFAVVVFLAAGFAYAKDYEVKKKAGDYDLTIKIDRNPPIVGDNNISIEIMDASRKIIKDAQVKVEYSMPAMPGMPPMNYKADADFKGDEYKTTLGLSMSGSWNVTVKITREGKSSSLKFTVDAK